MAGLFKGLPTVLFAGLSCSFACFPAEALREEACSFCLLLFPLLPPFFFCSARPLLFSDSFNVSSNDPLFDEEPRFILFKKFAALCFFPLALLLLFFLSDFDAEFSLLVPALVEGPVLELAPEFLLFSALERLALLLFELFFVPALNLSFLFFFVPGNSSAVSEVLSLCFQLIAGFTSSNALVCSFFFSGPEEDVEAALAVIELRLRQAFIGTESFGFLNKMSEGCSPSSSSGFGTRASSFGNESCFVVL